MNYQFWIIIHTTMFILNFFTALLMAYIGSFFVLINILACATSGYMIHWNWKLSQNK